jgi:hypothetical protein
MTEDQEFGLFSQAMAAGKAASRCALGLDDADPQLSVEMKWIKQAAPGAARCWGNIAKNMNRK